jgi:hypothetical protein
MNDPTKTIRIRAVDATGEGLRYFVTRESDAAIELDNRSPVAELRQRVTLVKMPNGRLANSAGQEFDIKAIETGAAQPERLRQRYELRLTTEDGELLSLWTLGGADDEDSDVVYPIRKLGPASLAEMINAEIAAQEAK